MFWYVIKGMINRADRWEERRTDIASRIKQGDKIMRLWRQQSTSAGTERSKMVFLKILRIDSWQLIQTVSSSIRLRIQYTVIKRDPLKLPSLSAVIPDHKGRPSTLWLGFFADINLQADLSPTFDLVSPQIIFVSWMEKLQLNVTGMTLRILD